MVSRETFEQQKVMHEANEAAIAASARAQAIAVLTITKDYPGKTELEAACARYLTGFFSPLAAG
jgi:hypothetical protein